MQDEELKMAGKGREESNQASKPGGAAPTAVQVGQSAERLAAAFLRQKGFKIRDLNYRCRRGEIDIVAEEDDTIVFVEVKFRAHSSHGTPAEAVTRRKQTRIVIAAAFYALEKEVQDRPMRFDIVEIFEHRAGAQPTCRLWRSAFCPSGSYVPL